MKLNCKCSHCGKLTIVTDKSPGTTFYSLTAVQFKCAHCGYTVLASHTEDLEKPKVTGESSALPL
jgi:ribosomal protein S27AE